MKTVFSKFLIVFFIVSYFSVYSQHAITVDASLDIDTKTITIKEKIVFKNTSTNPIKQIILNDWNNSLSSNNTSLAKVFSDEFNRNYFLAKEKDKSKTTIFNIQINNVDANWQRLKQQQDLIVVNLEKSVLPKESVEINLAYNVKLPNAIFTKFGFYNDEKYALKNWIIAPNKMIDNQFIKYSNINIDEITTEASDYQIKLQLPKNLIVTSNLTENSNSITTDKIYFFEGKSILEPIFHINNFHEFNSYKKNGVEILSNLQSNYQNDIHKALIINQIIDFVSENLGEFPNKKMIVSQADYERNPFYGLNQLPSYLSPFSDEFIFELKFLKTYLNTFLRNSMQIDYRKDGHLLDGINVFLTIKYIETFHQDKKMTGSVNRFKILKNYHLTNVSFNDQFSYFYMLMLRKNLDQAVAENKENQIKYNEQIAGRYRSALNYKYLDAYLKNDIVEKSFANIFKISTQKNITFTDFELLLKSEAKTDIDWFFKHLVFAKDAIDYHFEQIKTHKDSVEFSIKSKNDISVPIPVYLLQKDSIIDSKWISIEDQKKTNYLPKHHADQIVINHENIVPEINLRNNYKTLDEGKIFNKPFQFSILKDLENPAKNQLIYNPSAIYNLYDGISPGLRFHNKTMLDKPFNFDITPTYSINTNSLIGNFSFAVNEFRRNSNPFQIKYFVFGTYMHYAPDAAYFKLNPTIFMRFREKDRRNNKSEALTIRQVMVFLEPSQYDLGFNNNKKNYSIFNVKYNNQKKEISHHYDFTSELQFEKSFGKSLIDFEYRQLFGNRQLNIRTFAGIFLFNNTTNNYFSFALDRPSDYMFEYNYYGRSETTGIFSQQMVLKDGAFKSKLNHRYANNWMMASNVGITIWNWIEAYADAGFIKNYSKNANFLYDSGIRLNLVPDYFELYFPIHSSNGWETSQSNYEQKIRFIITLNPSVLVNLFTRKWF